MNRRGVLNITNPIKNGLIIGIESLEKRIKKMASEKEVQFYIERKKMLDSIGNNEKEFEYYMVLLDNDKNGAD